MSDFLGHLSLYSALKKHHFSTTFFWFRGIFPILLRAPLYYINRFPLTFLQCLEFVLHQPINTIILREKMIYLRHNSQDQCRFIKLFIIISGSFTFVWKFLGFGFNFSGVGFKSTILSLFRRDPFRGLYNSLHVVYLFYFR